MSTSKLPKKPEPRIDTVTGRRTYPGSIADTAGGQLTPSQQKAIFLALSKGPAFASALQIDGISPFSVYQQQGLHTYLQDLGTKGLASFDGKKGWSLSSTGSKYLEKLKEADDE